MFGENSDVRVELEEPGKALFLVFSAVMALVLRG